LPDREGFHQQAVVEAGAASRTARAYFAGLEVVEEGQEAQALPLVPNPAAEASTALAHEAGSFGRWR